MGRIRLAMTALLLAFTVPALAQAPAPTTPVRVRGTVEKLDGDKLTVKARDGQSVTITLAPNYTVSALVKRTVADIKPNDYVASAGVKGTDGKIHAVEVRIFPESLRGAGEGQNPWDLAPESVMTNATVTGTATEASGQILKVTYKGTTSEYCRTRMPGVRLCPRGCEPAETRRRCVRGRPKGR